jgi:hypothetical protein
MRRDCDATRHSELGGLFRWQVQSFGYDDYGNNVWEENQLRQRTTYTDDAYKRLVKTKIPLRQGDQLQLRSHQW